MNILESVCPTALEICWFLNRSSGGVSQQPLPNGFLTPSHHALEVYRRLDQQNAKIGPLLGRPSKRMSKSENR